MKKISILILVSISLISFNIKISGQEDTVIIENSTEQINESDLKQKRKYLYLDNNLREEKRLLKVGISPLGFLSYQSNMQAKELNGSLIFEQKLKPSLSLIINNNFDFSRIDKYYTSFMYSTDLGIRYYYSINKIIKSGAGANNFNNNYFSVKLDNISSYTYQNITNYSLDSTQSQIYTDKWSFSPLINISWGMQRRIGKWWFVDAGPYIRFKENQFGFGLNLLLGFGWGQ